MDQAFDAFFQFDKGAVRDQVDNFAFDMGADRIFFLDLFPWVGLFLLQAKGYAAFFFVDVQNDDFQFVAQFDHFGRMADALPCHVGDVQ